MLYATHQPSGEGYIEHGHRYLEAKVSGCSSSHLIAVCGDPVVGRALVLLLQGAGYEAKFSSVLSSNRAVLPGVLADIGLVLVTSLAEFSAERQRALLASLGEAAEKAGVPILELVFTSENTGDDSDRTVPWPCSIEMLSRRIEKALHVRENLCKSPPKRTG